MSYANDSQMSKSSEAFTLVELLTVLAILGILGAILVPVVGGVRAQARSAQCASNLRQIGMAILGYASENKGRLPQVAHLGAMGGESVSWVRTLRPWLGNTDAVRICPSDRYASAMLGLPDVTSYVLNDRVFTYPGDGDDGMGGVVQPRALSTLDRVRYPSRTLAATVINDERWPRAVTSDHLHADFWTNWPSVIGDISPDIHRSGIRSVSRDSGRSNYLFMDGHVESWDASRFRARIEAGENPAIPPS